MVGPSTPAHRVMMHHAPNELVIARISNIRTAAQHFAETIVDMCPPSADRSAALRKVREAMMSANASLVVPQDDVALLNREPCLSDTDVADDAGIIPESEMPF